MLILHCVVCTGEIPPKRAHRQARTCSPECKKQLQLSRLHDQRSRTAERNRKAALNLFRKHGCPDCLRRFLESQDSHLVPRNNELTGNDRPDHQVTP